ncbi:hypothetical protein GY45DRAFT_1437249 [Cubamyces sp. BRFM 1775]|nr:hypothetical protein GY45DRAFT_1437249 [Cubamyces sp. BRFM 1775]
MPLEGLMPAFHPSLAVIAQVPHIPSLDSSIGALLIGTFISLILYGVNILQLSSYLSLYYRSDSTPMRILVMTFMSLNILLVLASITSFFAEGFFVRRVSLIGTKSSIVALLAVLCLLTSNGLNIVSAAKAFQNEEFQSFGVHGRDINAAALSLSAFANYLLAGAIIVALYRGRSCQSRWSWIEIVTLYVVNTGILTGILQMVATLAFLLHPTSLYWSACGIVALKLRAVTLLSVLNSRKSMVDRGITVFNNSNYGRAAIARARRIAVANQFNVPRDLSHEVPPVINIKVAAEVEVHGQSDGDKSSISKGSP